MPRNRSEKQPTIEGVDDEALQVLRADAKDLHTRGSLTPQAIHGGASYVRSKDGDLRYIDLGPDQSLQYRALTLKQKREFIADYMEYLHAT